MKEFNISNYDLFALRKSLEARYDELETLDGDYTLLQYIGEGIYLAGKLEDWLAGAEKEGI